MSARFPLRIVDGLALPVDVRQLLRPGEAMADREGRQHRLPRWFYEIPTWDVARETNITPNFHVWEFIDVDVRETERLRAAWPRYVPCAVTLLAAHLELFRQRVGTYVHVAANGGYRSPAHRRSTHASTHCWGTAVNLYRVGDDWLESERAIARYRRVLRELMPAVYVRPYGAGIGEADDHLHLDLGFTEVVPHGAPAAPDQGWDDRLDDAPEAEDDEGTAEPGGGS